MCNMGGITVAPYLQDYSVLPRKDGEALDLLRSSC